MPALTLVLVFMPPFESNNRAIARVAVIPP
jgi:hypothetical protein